MKSVILYLIGCILFLSSCSKIMTPYEAAHTSHKHRKCSVIR
jgi:PBP1b-binding outer membrane lipoprotein LpoB